MLSFRRNMNHRVCGQGVVTTVLWKSINCLKTFIDEINSKCIDYLKTIHYRMRHNRSNRVMIQALEHKTFININRGQKIITMYNGQILSKPFLLAWPSLLRKCNILHWMTMVPCSKTYTVKDDFSNYIVQDQELSQYL